LFTAQLNFVEWSFLCVKKSNMMNNKLVICTLKPQCGLINSEDTRDLMTEVENNLLLIAEESCEHAHYCDGNSKRPGHLAYLITTKVDNEGICGSYYDVCILE